LRKSPTSSNLAEWHRSVRIHNNQVGLLLVQDGKNTPDWLDCFHADWDLA